MDIMENQSSQHTERTDTKVVIKTSENDMETAKKMKQISHMLMERNKQAYKELANIP